MLTASFVEGVIGFGFGLIVMIIVLKIFRDSRLMELKERVEALGAAKQEAEHMLQEEVWEITQQYLDARRRGKWLLNTSNCFSFQRPCEYLPYCQSGFNPNIVDNLYQIVPPHEELSTSDSESAPF